jgi:hypothetical protein
MWRVIISDEFFLIINDVIFERCRENQPLKSEFIEVPHTILRCAVVHIIITRVPIELVSSSSALCAFARR